MKTLKERSINVLLSALNDGKLDVAYLRTVARSWNDEISPREEVPSAPRHPHHASLG